MEPYLQQIGQAGEHVSGDGRNVIHTLAVLQDDPYQQQDCPTREQTAKDVTSVQARCWKKTLTHKSNPAQSPWQEATSR